MSVYRVPFSDAESEFTEKRSRFISHIWKIASEEEAQAHIREMKSRYYDARHNCWCYRLGENTARYSDDGEPQGTAGIPALDALQKAELTDLVVVCTRYFGGIMLGAGGLVRAYSHTAKIAAEAAGIITMARCTLGEVTCDYTYYGRLVPLLCSHGAIVEDTAFADSVTVRFKVPASAFGALCEAVVDTSFGKVRPLALGEIFDKIS